MDKSDPQNQEWTPDMNQNKDCAKGKGGGPQLFPVRFESTHPAASSVCVAGCFNQWQPEAKSLHPSEGGRWLKETALPPGTYEYCLVVDGRWMPDPSARESVPNPFGGRNSLLRVIQSQEARHLADAENLPLKNPNKSKRTKI